MCLKRRCHLMLGLALSLLAGSSFGASAPTETSPNDLLAVRALHYSFPQEQEIVPNDRPLGRAQLLSPSVGAWIGDTWWDMQHYGSMGRMVDWGYDSLGGEGFMVHFNWMRLATSVDANRHYAYNVYYADGEAAGTFMVQTQIQSPGEYAGFTGIDITADGRAVLGGQNNQGGGLAGHFYWDFGPGFGFFGANERIPDTVWFTDHNIDTLFESAWPKFRYQDVPGHESVTHVFLPWLKVTMGEWMPLCYFRKVGDNDQGDWNYPPFNIVDTVFNIAYDVACSDVDGKVALVWLASLPDPGDCDTCSSSTGGLYPDRDNDLYYRISYDYGETFQPRVNVTQNVDGDEGYRPYMDVSALITSDNDLHIAWTARRWPADAGGGGDVDQTRSRIFHWGENLSAGNIRTAANLEWYQTDCNGGAYQLNGSKVSLSECEGKLYCLWTQFNDPNVMMNDCARRAWSQPGGFSGSANGELYAAMSDDMGLTWSQAWNLTNSHTPNCDSSSGSGGRCASEHWASMARFGTDITGADMSQAVTVDPTGVYTGDHFLDVMYIDDADPGAAVLGEGVSRQADVRWFRLACFDNQFVPWWWFWPWSIGFPTWTPHGQPLTRSLHFENFGPVDILFTVQTEEDSTGAPPGWLAIPPELQGTLALPSGEDNELDSYVILNAGGVVNAPGTIVHLKGRLIFDRESVEEDDYLPIECWVADTLYQPEYDTLTTGALALVVGSNGNYANQGAGKVNMDFFNYGDCDSLEGAEDSIPGDATVYIYDASPVICWPDGDSVICNWSIFGQGYVSDNGFMPLGHTPTVDLDSLLLYESQFVTNDSGILVRQGWFVPPSPEGFLVHVLMLTSADGQTHYGLNIGEAIDWDIPADTGSRNRSGFNLSNRLIWQNGSEYDDDDAVECQENSDRYGGIAFLEAIEIDGADTICNTDFYGAYTEDNSTYVYPAGGFVREELDSNMTANEGYVIESDSLDADLHMVMTFRSGYVLTPSRKLIVISCLASGRNGYAQFINTVESCWEWREYFTTPPQGCCISIRGNVDYDAGDAVDISDLVYLVDYMFTSGPSPQCFEEADMNADLAIDISDLVYLVDYMFSFGPPPEPCPGWSGDRCRGIWNYLDP